MKNILTSIGFFSVLLSMPILAEESVTEAEVGEIIPVDFSKVYCYSKADEPAELRINGIGTFDDDETLEIRSIRLGIEPENFAAEKKFQVLEATPQEPDAELFEQSLLNTTWTGDYKTARNNRYQTELRFESVQNGFVAGEIMHTSGDHPENPSSLLRAKVAGEVVTQYLIDEKDNDELVWVDADQIDYGNLPAEVVIPPEEDGRTRLLIRLQRMRGIEFKHASSSWGNRHEYRMVLAGDTLSGSVGTPTDRYGSTDVLTGTGEIELTPVMEEVVDSLE